MSKSEFRILSPTAILGYGYPVESFLNGMKERPDLIAVDAGSVDPGPYYLGAGKSFTDRAGVKRDLRYMLKHAMEASIPVVIGSAGGAGAKPHVDWCKDIILEIAAEEALEFKMGVIYGDVSKERVLQSIADKKTTALAGLPELTDDTVRKSCRIVAQMGVEPIINALKEGCQVVLAGRAYDPTVFAALPIMKGYDPGLALHLGKILECAAIAADPGSGSDCVLGILKQDSFVLKPLSNKRRFTKTSVAAHTLYEKSDPYHLPGPGGMIDLTNVCFDELEDGMVEVTGSQFVPSEANMIKLEAVASVGFRTVSVAGMRDPIMIAKIDAILEKIRAQVDDILKTENISGKVVFHLYGKNGVMGDLEPQQQVGGHEMCVVIEAVAEKKEIADSICSITRSSLLHYGYDGRISTAGNLAFPFSPSDFSAGEVFEFSIYHLIEVMEGEELFPLEVVTVGGDK